MFSMENKNIRAYWGKWHNNFYERRERDKNNWSL
jgi:hypothetical protein